MAYTKTPYNIGSLIHEDMTQINDNFIYIWDHILRAGVIVGEENPGDNMFKDSARAPKLVEGQAISPQRIDTGDIVATGTIEASGMSVNGSKVLTESSHGQQPSGAGYTSWVLLTSSDGARYPLDFFIRHHQPLSIGDLAFKWGGNASGLEATVSPLSDGWHKIVLTKWNGVLKGLSVSVG